MNKLDMHTLDITESNIAKLMELFPSCVTEAKDEETGEVKRAIDFDLLRQELSGSVVDGPRERYQLSWPGKREALLIANAPIAKTLRPCRSDSVGFDDTKNLFIEGDNLEGLKLLQDTYLNSLKMIYVDPPYNIGKDFLYDDDFAESADEYFARSQQSTSDGVRLVANTESNGRFHSDWLSRLYPRLKIARNLLKNEGVIFISIDDRELHNLRKVCDEVFSEKNFIGCIVWKNATDNNPTNIASEHEYIVVYGKNKSQVSPVWKSHVSDVKEVLVKVGNELIEKHRNNEEELQAAYSEWFRRRKSELWPLDGYKFIDAGGVYAGIRGVHNPGKEGYRYDVIHPETKKPCTEPLMGYRFPKETMDKLLASDKIIFGDDHTKLIELKSYAHEYQEKLSSVFELDGRSGAYDVRELFPEYKTAFKNPKPIKLLQRLAELILTEDGDCILDLYAGSGTTAHAVLELNKRDQVQRRFIMMQLAEPCNPDSEVAKAGIETISELCMERIRRASKKVESSIGLSASVQDLGLRVLKIDSTCMKPVFYSPGELSQETLDGLVDNIRDDRTDEDLLFQVLLDWGVDLTLPIATDKIAGKPVFFVDTDALVACFAPGIDEDFIKELAKRKPLRAVFRDNGYGSDATKINVEQIFKQLSPTTEVKSI